MEQPKSAPTVQSLERGLDILAALSRSERPLGITELANELGLAKGSVSRLVTTLVEQRFLSRDPATAKYRLGVRLWELGRRVLSRNGVADIAHPYLERLAAETQETAHITVMGDEGEMVFLEKLDSSHPLRPNIQLGPPHPPYCTANGKAILAFLPQPELEKILPARLRRHTDSTITSKSALLEHLETVRRIGYAVNRGEYRADISGVAAPILDADGWPIAALGLSVLTSRMSAQLARELGTRVRKDAAGISSALARAE